LHTQWHFWCYERPEPQPGPESKVAQVESYKDRLKSLGAIPTLEHFFNFYVFLKKPSEMPKHTDLFLFRAGEMPMWEVSLAKFASSFRSRQTEEFGS
jgi:hypothetical protein